jgi:4-amino-4-deoxy-L-arabinose transferase-like glycosyltransferase
MKRSTRIILALLLLAFGLRVWNLAGQSFWWDEAFTWQTTSHGFANLWQMLLTGDRNPPLYFLSVALWGSLTGWSEFSLRFASVCWMMIGLSFLFNLTKRLYNTSAGLWTLTLAAVVPALVIYAQEARMYAAFFALTAATLYFAWRVFEFGNQQSKISNQKLIWAFLWCEAGLLLTHYFAIPLVVTLNLLALSVLLQRRARFAAYAKWIGGQVLAASPMAIWTLIVLTTPGSLIGAQEAPPEVFAFLNQVVMLWLSGVRDLQGDWIALPWLTVLILPVALIGAWLVNGRSTRWVVAFTILSLGVAYAMTLLLTSFHPRYALPYSVPLFVIMGAALANLSALRLSRGKRLRGGRRVIGAAAALLVLIALVAGEQAASAATSAKDDVRGMAAYLKFAASVDDVILQEANDYTLNYYDHGPAQLKMITATNESDALAQLSAAISNARRVWLPHWKVSRQDPRGYWPFLLEQSGSLKSRTPFHGYDLAEYEMRLPLHQPELQPASSGSMVVQHSDIEEADGALAFALTWQTPVKFFDPARVSVRLIDSRGNILNARDNALLDERGRTTDQWDAIKPVTNAYVLPTPPGTPPGTYTITAQLYNARDVLANETVGTIELPLRLDMSDPYGTLSGYHWWKPEGGDILPGVTLEAVSQSGTRQGVLPLDQVDVVLRWRKTGDATNLKPRLRLIQGDRIWAEVGSHLFERDYPFEQWVVGETVIDRLKIEYPPLRGPIDLQAGQGDQWITLAPLTLDASALKFEPPAMQHAQSAQFGDFAELLGYDLKADSLSASRPLDLKLIWRATNTEPITTPYTVFTQILAPDGHLVAQHDAPPTPPTTQWVPGQIVIDHHPVKIIDSTYRGPATLIVGWYNSASVERVPANSGGDFALLSVPVRVEDQ